MVRSLLALVFATLVACGGDTRPRCGQCGMYADVAPAFAAGAISREGETMRFDAPRCMFAWLASSKGRGARDVWVTEHYAQRHVDAASVVYVAGSDVVGPMGRDLVPVDRASAERFVADHGGRIVERNAIDAAVLRSLDP